MNDAGSEESGLTLLKAILQPFLNVAEFYVGSDPLARKARKKVNKGSRQVRRPESAFYATIIVHLSNLKSAVESWTEFQFLASASARQAVQQLLDALEGVIRDSDDTQPSTYTALKVVRETRELDRKRLFCPSPKFRKRLENCLAACVSALRADHTRNGIASLATSISEWEPAKEFCESIERLHDKILGHTQCDCRVQHESVFSFALPCCQDGEPARCCLFFRRQIQKDWYKAEMQLDYVSQPSGSHFTSVKNQSVKEFQASDGGASLRVCGKLCEALVNCENLLIIPSRTELNLSSLPERAQPIVTAMATHRELMQSGETSVLGRASETDRIIVALLLSYAYLHLSGGSWWPNLTLDPTVWFLIGATTPHTTALWRPFLSFDPPQSSESFRIETAINKERPSLPAFGKLLLEIWVGKPLTWDNEQLQQVEEQCKKTMVGKQYFEVANACIRQESIFHSEKMFREHKSMRGLFLAKVVKVLQYMLSWEMSMENIFAMQKPLGPDALRSRGIESPSGSSAILTNKCLRDGLNPQEGEYERTLQLTMGI